LIFVLLLIKNDCGTLFASIGIFGASRLYEYLVLTTAIWCCIDLVWSALTNRWIGVGLSASLIYPHLADPYQWK
jgi:hypothetical protein